MFMCFVKGFLVSQAMMISYVLINFILAVIMKEDMSTLRFQVIQNRGIQWMMYLLIWTIWSIFFILRG